MEELNTKTEMQGTAKRPDTYMWLAIISTLMTLFFPIGLISLFYSLKVNRCWKKGKEEKALKASTRAKNWGIAGIVTGILMIIFSSFVIAGIIVFITSVIIPLLTVLSSFLPILAPLTAGIATVLVSVVEFLLPIIAGAITLSIHDSIVNSAILLPLF